MKFYLSLMSDFRYNNGVDYRIKEMKKDLKSTEEPGVSDADLVATDSYSEIINESKRRGYSKYSYYINTRRFLSYIGGLKHRYQDKKYALFSDAILLLMGIIFGVILLISKIYFFGILVIIISFLMVYYLQWRDQEIRNRISANKG